MVVAQLSPAAIGYLFAVLVAIAITAGFARYAWRRRNLRGATSLAVIMTGGTVWSASIVVQFVSAVDAVTVGVQTVLLGGVGLVVAGFFGLGLEFSGREDLLDRRVVGLLAVEPAAIVVLTATNPWHGLVWQSIEPATATFDTVVIEPAIAFWIHTAYSYLLSALALGMISIEAVRSHSIYRRQAIALLVGAVLPSAANILEIAQVVVIDLQPFAFALTGLILGWNIRRYRIIDLIPVAREQVVDTLPDPVIVLDGQDRITDVNEAAVALLGANEDELIGTDFDAAFAEFPLVVDALGDAVQTDEVVRLPLRDEVRFYEIRGAPIDAPDGTRHGRVLVFHDVTGREQGRRELERQNEQLERFASVVSHDLRNPLSVADGYLPMARESGDAEHFDAIEESLDRMNAIIDDVLTLAREGSQIDDRSPVSIEHVAETAWEQVDTGDAELIVADDVTIGADRTRLQRLFENLFRNAVEHGSTSPPSTSSREDAVEHGSTSPGSPSARQDAVEHGSTSPPSTSSREDAVGTSSDVPSVADAPEDAVEHGADGNGGDPLTITVGPIGHEPSESLRPADDFGFYVEDDGVGIPEADRETIFEPGHSSSSEGTGLGLSIVQGIAEAHGWSIRATDAEGGGARFEVTGAPPISHPASVSAPDGAQR